MEQEVTTDENGVATITVDEPLEEGEEYDVSWSAVGAEETERQHVNTGITGNLTTHALSGAVGLLLALIIITGIVIYRRC